MAATSVPAGLGFLTRETIAGVAQFTGLDGAGGFAFNQLDTILLSQTRLPKILMLGYAALGAAHEVSFFLARDNVAGDTQRIRIGGSRIKDDGTLSLTLQATVAGCELGSPGVVLGGVLGAYYRLQVVTTGKTGEGTWSMWWEGSVDL